MELLSEVLEEIAFSKRPKIEENMIVVVDKSSHEEHLAQPLQTTIKQFKIALTFLTGYNCIFNVTSKNDKFCFTVSIIDDDFSQITNQQGTDDPESLDEEIRQFF